MRWGWGVAQKCDAAAAWWRAADQGLLPVDFLSHIYNQTFLEHLHFTSWDNNVDCCKISFRVWLICRHNNRRNSQDRPIHRHFVANEYFCQILNAKNAVLCEAKLLHPWIMVRTFTFLLDFFQFWGKFSDFVDGQQNNTPGLILIKYQYPAHSALLTVLTVLSSLHSSDHHSVLHIVLQLSTVLCTWFSKTLHTTILQCCITIRRLTRTPSSPVPLNIQCSLKDYFLTKVS